MKYSVLCCAIILLWGIPTGRCQELQVPTPAALTRDGTNNAVLTFAHRLAEKLLLERNDKTLLFSPLSITDALYLLLLGARTQTYGELTQLLLGGGDQPATSTLAVHREFEGLLETLLSPQTNQNTSDPDHFIQVANGLFIDSGFSLVPDYRTVAESVYKAETFSVDFQAPSVLSQINHWVEERTRGKITNIVSKAFDKNTKMVIASTVYFNAKWQTTFFEEQTKQRPFWMNGRDKPPVQVEMMALGGHVPFYEAVDHNCRILGLPYKNSVSVMYVIMPTGSTTVRQLHSQLTAPLITEMIRNMTLTKTIVFLPKMLLESQIDVGKEIADLGAKTLFDPKTADLGLIAQERRPESAAAAYLPKFNASLESGYHHRLEDVLLFSRFNGEARDMDGQKRSKRNTYKASSSNRKSVSPLEMKDFILRKRIMKENKLDKKPIRSRRSLRSTLEALQSLEHQRNNGLSENPQLFANEILHKVKLNINEKGTEGGAATLVMLQKSGTNLFKAEEPFLFFIRHEATELPIFYGAVFDPRP